MIKISRFWLLPFMKWASKLRYPALFKVAATLFAITLVVPDPIPMVDEIILGLATMLLARWKTQGSTPVSNARADFDRTVVADIPPSGTTDTYRSGR